MGERWFGGPRDRLPGIYTAGHHNGTGIMTTIDTTTDGHATRDLMETPAETERDLAADTLARVSTAHEIARVAYLRAETDLTEALRAETPLIGTGHLTPAELTGAKLALRAAGREVRVEHWPGTRYRVAPSEAGAERIARARAALADLQSRYFAAVEAVQVAEAILAAIDAEQGRAPAPDPIAADVEATLAMEDAIAEALAGPDDATARLQAVQSEIATVFEYMGSATVYAPAA